MSELDSIAMAVRGKEITGLDIFQTSAESITAVRVEELVSEMNADQPTGGTDMAYGKKDTQHLRFWKATSSKAPIVVFVHGGSWRSGTNLDLIGSAKVDHLISKGYAFATVNYTLIPFITVEEQVQEVADSVGYLVKNAARLDFDPDRVILMGHSSGAHVVTLLGTDPSYLERAGISLDIVRGVISLDGSNYNALAEITDSPGPVADNTIYGLGSDPERLHAMSPTYHAHAPNVGAFLLLHVHRQGGVRQAVELVAALKAAGTDAVLRVFEGQGFEGHIQMLLQLGDPAYPATLVMDEWLRLHVPVD
ncbi:Alpha/Beta hydrolase protein [Aspergillus pseudotamarii]|uniref:Alpha/Beta hydrolase protein n=1 Tax=Aspergillus pseudotamarii TaxID=132259 RepID=A0A5N6SDL0_ASPPS|nr:Alpha/Beta hydrolase protein [Aspergillus pseudotamarii]KAE8132705.1 Alpha/Beta hydrolase protein [Aspergillus pseudotamarii]